MQVASSNLGARLTGAVAVLALLSFGAALAREPLSDAQIREIVVKESVARYLATGHPCACPYNLMRNGRQCGNVSAYVRPGGASPLCYAKDVSDGMVADWKRAHP